MSTFAEAQIVEIRIYDDPSNPNTSPYRVALPMTVLEAITDPNTGESLVNLLANQNGELGNHVANIDIHVTPEWKANIQQSIGELIAFTQNPDNFVTAEQKQAWNDAAQNAILALATALANEGNINELSGRVLQIEDSLFNGITANPFSIGFDSLTGLLITYGIWNNTLKRVEC